jgi:LmbE family N-acetylglucosaminyl deacetylase
MPRPGFRLAGTASQGNFMHWHNSEGWHTAGPTIGARPGNGTTLFLLAHQDDELAFAPVIAAAKRAGRSVSIVYLTDGGAGDATPVTRNAETIAALGAMGVDAGREASFLGERLGIPDRFLYRHLPLAHEAVLAHVSSLPRIAAIYTHAWEGGNPDHDAAHVLALGIARSLEIEREVYQVPFYRAARGGPFPFRVFAPLAANGRVNRFRVGRIERLRALMLIRFFPSQVQAFMRLGPFMLLDALWQPGLPIQRVTLTRIRERPMPEPLRYERHGHDRFDRMAPYIEAYRRSVLEPALQSVRAEDHVASEQMLRP